MENKSTAEFFAAACKLYKATRLIAQNELQEAANQVEQIVLSMEKPEADALMEELLKIAEQHGIQVKWRD